MATLQYITVAENITGADKYKLYKRTYQPGTGLQQYTDTHIDTSKNLKEFPFPGIMVNGKEYEYSQSLDPKQGESSAKNGRPLRVLTENGIRYCIKIETQVMVYHGDGLSTARDCRGVHYFDEEVDDITDFRFWVSSAADNIFFDGDGYSLKCYLDGKEIYIRIVDDEDYIQGVSFGKTGSLVKLYSNLYHDTYDHTHSEYIPLWVLEDGWEPLGGVGRVCVGPFDLSGDDLDYNKMSFYDKNLKFVGGADTGYLAEKYGSSKRYFTRSEVLVIAQGITGKTSDEEEGYPEFVVFTSRTTNSEKNYTCEDGYFPLFAIPEHLFDDGENTLFVTADSDSKYYTESPASNLESYTVNKTKS